MTLITDPFEEAREAATRVAIKRKSFSARNAEDYERLYRNRQKWLHVALILKARIEGKQLPEATLTEWAESYTWVVRNVETK